MTAPAWAAAPKWATHRAMDSNGAWWWFEGEPERDGHLGIFCGGSRRTEAAYIAGWERSLEKRPSTFDGRAYRTVNPLIPVSAYLSAGWTIDLLLQHGHIYEVEG